MLSTQVAAHEEHIIYEDIDEVKTVKCSDYPNASRLKLTVNNMTESIWCDNIPPSWSVTYSTTDWTNEDVIVTASCEDNNSWCVQSEYTKTISSNQSGTIAIQDNAWNTTHVPYNVSNIDKRVPTLDGVYCDGIDANGNSAWAVTCSVRLDNRWPSEDSLIYEHSTIDGELPDISDTLIQSYTYTDNGTYTVSAQWRDEAWNTAQWESLTFTIDTSNPSIRTNFDFNLWYNNNSLWDISFQVKDQESSESDFEVSWLDSLEVTINGNTVPTSWFTQTTWTESVDVTVMKTHIITNITDTENNTVVIKATDRVWHTQELTYTLKYDNTQPTVSASGSDETYNYYPEIILNLDSEVSTIAASRYSWNEDIQCDEGNEQLFQNGDSITLTEQWDHILYLCARDMAWNIGAWQWEYTLNIPLEVFLENIQSSSLAGEDNVSINWVIVHEDTLVRENLTDIQYSLSIEWPIQTWYGWYIDENIKNSVSKSLSWNLDNQGNIEEEVSLIRAGIYNITVLLEDEQWKQSEDTTQLTIYPNTTSIANSTLSRETDQDKYANNLDTYTYILTLKDDYGNRIYDKEVGGITHSCIDYTWCNNIRVDTSVPSSDYALSIVTSQSTVSDDTWSITFEVRSLAPWEFTERFEFTTRLWDKNYNNTGTSLYTIWDQSHIFMKPFRSELQTSKNNGESWDWLPDVGSVLRHRLHISENVQISASNFRVEDFWDTIDVYDTQTTLSNMTSVSNLNSRNPDFQAQIDTTEDVTNIADLRPWIRIPETRIYYSLAGSEISYTLPQTSISNDEYEFLGVQVIGRLQWEGRQTIVGQDENITDLYNSELRTDIRRNAYNHIRSMSSGQTAWGVHYINWEDITLSSMPDYETLVVIDGNVRITGDLVWEKFGIIVLKDGYNVQNDYWNNGNIYISPQVQNIEAMIYADWWIISVNNNWEVYIENTIERNNELNRQLVITWSIITRNTIWGALQGQGEAVYLLPGGMETSNFNTAMIYDLNYLRRGRDNCEPLYDDTETCMHQGTTVIEYNPDIVLNPPRLFSN